MKDFGAGVDQESKMHKLIEKHFPKVKADKMLSDLSSIALEWAKSYVRQRQTFKMNTKGENMPPLAFQSDPDGTYHDLAVQLKNLDVEGLDEDEGSFPTVDSVDAPEISPDRSKRKAIRLKALKFKKQQATITAWIENPKHVASTCPVAIVRRFLRVLTSNSVEPDMVSIVSCIKCALFLLSHMLCLP
jgi:hypothetical protein